MDTQTAFEFANDGAPVTPHVNIPNEPPIGTLNALVLAILSEGNWIMPWEICERLRRNRKLQVSDSSITARLRDLRKDQFGKHVIELRKRAGSRAFEYRLLK
jgi:hypothetical protein